MSFRNEGTARENFQRNRIAGSYVFLASLLPVAVSIHQSTNMSYYNSISHHLCPGGWNVLKAGLMAVFSYLKDKFKVYFFFLLPKVFPLLVCCKLVLARSLNGISLPLAESLVLDHYRRQKYCL